MFDRKKENYQCGILLGIHYMPQYVMHMFDPNPLLPGRPLHQTRCWQEDRYNNHSGSRAGPRTVGLLKGWFQDAQACTLGQSSLERQMHVRMRPDNMKRQMEVQAEA